MIITRLANTAIDRVAGDEGRIAGEIVQFSASDMVCYRADAPDSLVARQAEQWDPVLDWAHRALGCRFICVAGVMHQAQPDLAGETARGAKCRKPVAADGHSQHDDPDRLGAGGDDGGRR
jgi:chaperone required for assembly of F1-ATPase